LDVKAAPWRLQIDKFLQDPSAAGLSAADALPEHVSHHVETIAALHAQAESQVSLYQRTVEVVAGFLGRPLFLYITQAVVVLWVVVNLLLRARGARLYDAPPFYWLQGLVGLGALLLTIVVLITQNRQGKLAERRAQLDLQVSLSADQKIAKLIALVEELRRDLPSVKDRVDPEAEAMSEAADPHAVLEALEEKLEEALEEKLEEAADLVKEAQEARG
jgi:uncharacterized membrane protein